MGRSENLLIFLEFIAALGLKVAYNNKPNELMTLNEYQGSKSFFYLGRCICCFIFVLRPR